MEIWKIVLLCVLGAVVTGCIIGVVVGKHSVRKAQSGSKPLLTGKERIIYAALLAAGAVCLVIGLVYKPASSGDLVDDGMMMGYEEDFGVMAGDPDGMEYWDEDADMAIADSNFADGEPGKEFDEPADADRTESADADLEEAEGELTNDENPATAEPDDADTDAAEDGDEEVSRATGSQSGNATASTTNSRSRGGVVVIRG